MLVSDDDVNNYNKIKTDLDKLRLLVEQSELWIYKKKDHVKDSDDLNSSGNVTFINADKSSSKSDLKHNMAKTNLNAGKKGGDSLIGDQFVLQELDNGPDLDQSAIIKYKELYKILYSMIQLCVTEVTLPNGTVKKKPRRNDQRLLRNMGVHNIVLDLTKISYEKNEDKRIRIIMRTAHQFLQNFCFANPHNQALLHEKLDLTHYPSNEWEATTATHIFKDNPVLCNELNERLIQNFVHALEHQHVDESKVPYLEFLQTICIIDGHEVKKCQDMIIAEIINSDIMHFSSDKTHIDELCLLMQKQHPQSQEELSQEALIHRQILFHVNLIKVLISCTVGKNTFTEIKCHTVLSLEDIEKVVTNKHCIIQVKETYINFLYHCHVDTENETKEIFTQPYIWSIFENFIQDISLVAPGRLEPEYTDQLLENYVAENLVEVVIGFFSHTQFNQIPSPHVRSGVYKSLYAKMIQLYHCHWLSEKQKVNVSFALNAMQDKASFLGCTDMPLLRQIDMNFDLVSRSLQLPQHRQSSAVNAFADPSSFSLNEQNLTYLNLNRTHATNLNDANTPIVIPSQQNNNHNFISKMLSFDNKIENKHDTRIVNEAFQVTKVF